MPTLLEAVEASNSIRVYGVPITGGDSLVDLSVSAKGQPGASLAMVYSFRLGSFCQKLPVPIPVVVWGSPTKPDTSDSCANGIDDEQIWSMPASSSTTAISITRGSLVDILDEVSTRGISGGVQIENPRYENGKFCATIHAWAKIEVFGQKVQFDERIPVCVPVQGCYSVWDIGFARVEVCIKAPSDLCVKLCVGKWGLEKCWDACVHIPLATPQLSSSPKCSCEH